MSNVEPIFAIVGARFPLERAVDAVKLLDERGATGKVVLEPRQ